MIVDLEEKTESGTFEMKDGGRLHLRLLSGTDLKEMRKACVSTGAEYPLLDGKYQRFEFQRFNQELWSEMTWDRTITGWDDLFDKNKKPIPVTKESKILLMNRVPEFAEAYEAGLKAIKEAEKDRAAASEKN